ncbi:MAG: SRPBCC family protein [Micromonosporaceae bacterium]
MSDKTSSSTVVGAPRSTVMAVITDFPAYPEWAGSVRSCEVTEAGPDGRAKKVRFVLDAGFLKDNFVLLYDWEADSRVSWRLAEPTMVLSALDGSYLLADRDAGTEVTYELTVKVRIPMLGILKRRAEKMIIDQALKGLKKRAENIGGDR